MTFSLEVGGGLVLGLLWFAFVGWLVRYIGWPRKPGE